MSPVRMINGFPMNKQDQPKQILFNYRHFMQPHTLIHNSIRLREPLRGYSKAKQKLCVVNNTLTVNVSSKDGWISTTNKTNKTNQHKYWSIIDI